jgi:hypothetical protein
MRFWVGVAVGLAVWPALRVALLLLAARRERGGLDMGAERRRMIVDQERQAS